MGELIRALKNLDSYDKKILCATVIGIVAYGGYTFWRGRRKQLNRVYSGENEDGVPWGFGTCTWPDGTRYEGEWRDGKFHGKESGIILTAKYILVNMRMV